MRVKGIECRVLGFEFWVQAFGFRVLGLGVLGFGFSV